MSSFLAYSSMFEARRVTQNTTKTRHGLYRVFE